MTLGKVTIWELPGNMLCRVQWPLHSANITDLLSVTVQALGKGRHFAECLVGDTRQSGHLCRVSKSMPLGKSGTFVEYLTLAARRHGHFSLPSVGLALGKAFVECPIKCTRQRGLCR